MPTEQPPAANDQRFRVGPVLVRLAAVIGVVAASFAFTDRSVFEAAGLRTLVAPPPPTLVRTLATPSTTGLLSSGLQHPDRGERLLSADLDLGPGIDPGNFRLSDTGPEPSEMAEDEDSEDAQSERVVLVRRGDTLLDLLMGAGVPRAEARDAMSALRKVLDPRTIRPGQEIALTFGAPGAAGERPTLLQATFTPRADHVVDLSRGSDGRFSALKRDRALVKETVRAAGSVRSSLFEAGTVAGVPGTMMVELIRAFSYDVDFQRDIQVGDSFEMIFERYRDDEGKFVRDGNVLYLSLTLGNSTRRLWRHVLPDGYADYFNERGESVRKALLRTPVDGARLTSGFGSRLHPILGYNAMHRGVDFAAPEGTPVMAAGDGVIEQAGWNGAYGLYVRVRHNAEYSTAYAHLNRLSGGARVGTRVRQGQVIGYLGSTGRVTGAHLHYEILRRGTQINPLGVQLPTGRRLEGVELVNFRNARADILARAEPLQPGTRLAKAQ